MNNIETLKSLRSKYGLMIEARELYEELRTRAEHTTGTGYDYVPGSHDKRNKETSIIRLINAEDLYFTRLNAYLDNYAASVKILDAAELDPDQYSVLHGRYIQYKTFEKIALDIGRSTQWVYTIHSKALKKIEKVKINENI